MANKHISYRQFKNIFGDLGVTYWTKYNWLSNALPDGEYNGITKVTFNKLPPSATFQGWRAFWSTNHIQVEGSVVWAYGFSNYEIVKHNEMYSPGPNKTCISFGNDLNLHIVGLSTAEEYNAYLKDHPIILYYYDRNVWGGVILTSLDTGANVRYNDALHNILIDSNQNIIKDVKGDYEFNGYWSTAVSFKDTAEDLTIGLYKNPSSPGYLNRIYLKNNSYPFTAEGTTALVQNQFPKAIVYKLVPDGWKRVDIGDLTFTRVQCQGGSAYYFQASISDLPNNTQTVGQAWKDVLCDGNISITTVTYEGETVTDAAYVKKAGCSANNKTICFYFDYSKNMTAEEFKEWIKGKYFYYKLAVPR